MTTPAECPGPRLLPDDRCHFRVWAPRARHVALHLPGRADLPMQPVEGGCHEVEAGGVRPGQRYAYRLEPGGHPWPDPASRWQPDGVHALSAVAEADFEWHDQGWRCPPLRDLVLYELHVGTFTEQGTFEGAVGELDRLRDLGVNAVELMPVAQFPGTRNWGYDGVFPFAVQHSYGGVRGLKRLIDACHGRGIAVLLDVVWNHLGPEGNCLHHFGPYFSQQYRTPWGEALNLDGPGSDAVRDYFQANARMWQEEFRLDGLRIDAVPYLKDSSPRHLLAEVALACRERSGDSGRPFLLIAESDTNDDRVFRPGEHGGYALDATWSDDFHHALHALLTGERTGYYADHGTLDHLARAYRDAFVLAGQHSHFRGRRWGAPAPGWDAERFVVFAQNHDQVGNRPRGDRLSTLVCFETLKLTAGLLLLSPYTPMLWMGEEYGEAAPFPFFVSHSDGRLLDAIRHGRRRDYAAFGGAGEPPDPADERTFRSARLRTAAAREGRGRALCELHRELIGLRRGVPALADPSRERMQVRADEAGQALFVVRGEAAAFACHFGQAPARLRWHLPAGRWRRRLATADRRWDGPGDGCPEEVGGEVELPLAPRSLVLYLREG